MTGGVFRCESDARCCCLALCVNRDCRVENPGNKVARLNSGSARLIERRTERCLLTGVTFDDNCGLAAFWRRVLCGYQSDRARQRAYKYCFLTRRYIRRLLTRRGAPRNLLITGQAYARAAFVFICLRRCARAPRLPDGF